MAKLNPEQLKKNTNLQIVTRIIGGLFTKMPTDMPYQ